MKDTDIICGCNKVTVKQLTDLVNSHADITKEIIIEELGLGTKCGMCLDRVKSGANPEHVEVFYEDVLNVIGKANLV